MNATKKKILTASEKLFFIHGIANVRLQQIADEVGISVGNLAYHFNNKEAIVKTVYDKVFEAFSAILSTYKKSQDLSDFDLLFTTCFSFFTSNAFYLNNIWEINRSYPEIKKRWEQVNAQKMTQIKKRIKYNIEKGILNDKLIKDNLDELVQTLWITITFWIPQQLLLGQTTDELQYRKVLWSQLSPHLSAAGKKEKKQVISLE